MIQAGVVANAEIFATVSETVAEIRRLHSVGQRLAHEATNGAASTEQPLGKEAEEQ